MKWNVLIIDDDQNFRFAMREVIPWEAYGFEVVGEAIHGKKALEFMAKHDVDLILTDMDMPIMNGVELTKEVKSRYPGTTVVALSAYDDFAFVKESMRFGAEDYILKQSFDGEEVIKTLVKVRDKKRKETRANLEENKYQKEIWEYLQNQVPMGEDGHLYFYNIFRENHLAVYVLQAEGEELAVINNVVLQEESLLYYTKDNNGLWTLIYKTPESNSTEKIRSFLFAAARRLGKYADTGLRLAYFDGCDKFPNLPLLYQKAKTAFDYFVFFPERGTIVYSDIIEFERSRMRDFKYQIPDMLPATTPENVELILDDLMKKLMEYMPEPQSVNHSFLCVYQEFCRRKPMSAGHMDAIVFYEEIKKHASLAEKRQLLMERIRSEWKAEVIRYQGKSTEITLALGYIHKHYTTELSLKIISDYVGLSESYFSNLFKQEVGENLTHYVNRLRIAYAKELLRNQSIKVYEVAAKVGYQNATYFSTIFKKLTGQSISEYKSETKDP